MAFSIISSVYKTSSGGTQKGKLMLAGNQRVKIRLIEAK